MKAIIAESHYKKLEQDFRKCHLASLSSADTVVAAKKMLVEAPTLQQLEDVLMKLPAWLENLRKVESRKLCDEFLAAAVHMGKCFAAAPLPKKRSDCKDFSAYLEFTKRMVDLLGPELGPQAMQCKDDASQVLRLWEQSLHAENLSVAVQGLLESGNNAETMAEDVALLDLVIEVVPQLQSLEIDKDGVSNLHECVMVLIDIIGFKCMHGAKHGEAMEKAVSLFSATSKLVQHLSARDPDNHKAREAEVEKLNPLLQLSSLLWDRKTPDELVGHADAAQFISNALAACRRCEEAAIPEKLHMEVLQVANDYLSLLAAHHMKNAHNKLADAVSKMLTRLGMKDSSGEPNINKVWWRSVGKEAALSEVVKVAEGTILRGQAQ